VICTKTQLVSVVPPPTSSVSPLLDRAYREAVGLERLEQRVHQQKGAVEGVPRHLQVKHFLRRASHARRVISAGAPL
jgi:hypothetical protein